MTAVTVPDIMVVSRLSAPTPGELRSGKRVTDVPDVLSLGGRPFGEPVYAGGPFVMNRRPDHIGNA